MIFHNTKLINLGETEVSLFLFVLLVVFFPRREMQTTSRYASRTSASLGEEKETTSNTNKKGDRSLPKIN